MSNSYFNYTSPLIPGTVAKAQDVNQHFQGVESAFTSIEPWVVEAIKIPAGETTTTRIAENAVNRANKVVGFDADGNVLLWDNAGVYAGEAADSAAEAADSAAAALASEQAAASSESNASASETAAYNWAQFAEDALVPEGNGVDEYSAYHWAQKAATFNPLDFVRVDGTQVMTGGLTSTSNFGFTVDNAAPHIRWRESDQGADERYWDIMASGGKLKLRAVNDAYTDARNAITISRSGYDISRIDLDATLVDVSGALQSNGSLTGPLFRAEAVSPEFRLYETDAAVDEKAWGLVPVNGELWLGTRSDSNAWGQAALKISRSDTSISQIDLDAPLVDVSGTLQLKKVDPSFYLEDTDGGSNNVSVIGQRGERLYFWDADGGAWNWTAYVDNSTMKWWFGGEVNAAGIITEAGHEVVKLGKNNTANSNTSFASSNANTSLNGGAFQIREANYVGNTQSSYQYAPSIGFHWSGTTAASIALHYNGIFHFRRLNFDAGTTIGWSNIEAGDIRAHGDVVGGQVKAANSSVAAVFSYNRNLNGNACAMYLDGKNVELWSNEPDAVFKAAGQEIWTKGNDSQGLARRVLETSSTVNQYNGQWTKIARVTISGLYDSLHLALRDVCYAHSNATSGGGVANIWAKQQDAFGSDPYVDIEYVSNYNGTYTQYGYVIVQNTPSTIVDIYVKNNSTYNRIVFYESAKAISTGVTLEYLSHQSYASSVSGLVPVTTRAFSFGSNANGRWIRYADGTQICWGHSPHPGDWNKSTVILPVSFTAADYSVTLVPYSPLSNPTVPLTLESRAVGNFKFDSNPGETTKFGADWIAIGRWY